MMFHHRQRNIESMIPNLSINNHTIERVKNFNFLGITFDENMTWDEHINKISNKISKALGIMSRLKRYLPQEILLRIYTSLIMPHIQYGILCWGHKRERVYKLQKRAMRLITCSKYNAHTEPLYKKLKCLMVSDIYTQNLLKFHFKIENKTVPHYFKNMFTPKIREHTHDTRFRDDPITPIPNTSSGGNCLRYLLPKTLADTPSIILDKVTTHSPQGFSNYIKQYYINNYSEVCIIRNCFICKKNQV